MNWKDLIKLRGELPGRWSTILGTLGGLIIILIWYLLTKGETPLVDKGILPSPVRVFKAFGEMIREKELLRNTCLSLGYNFGGYIEAILISLPIGFLIGLLPIFKVTFQRPIDSLRYLPLTGTIGLFIVAFGIGTSMKTHFLAFGIIIYLIPIVVQRVLEVDEVYVRTAHTLGASAWQKFKTVFWPAVLSRISDDIRVLTAISWTYIIVSETIGGEGGLGSMIWRIGQRQGRSDIVYAILFLIIVIGIIQDKLLIRLDREIFPHKYQNKKKKYGNKPSIFSSIFDQISTVLIYVFVAAYILLLIDSLFPFIGNTGLLQYLFSDTVWAVHFIGIILTAWFFFHLFSKKKYGTE